MTLGIKYFSEGHITGYGIAGLGYIRALHNAGVPVWPFFIGPRQANVLPLARAAEGDPNFGDLAAVARATASPIPYDTVVAHTIPKYWRRFVEADKRFVGYTAWETETLPDHWRVLLEKADLILVPSRFSAERIVAGGVTCPVRAVPHIRRHAWAETAQRDGMALRSSLGIPADHYVFYTIGVWEPRKAVGELIYAFARAFSATDPVALVVKTSASIQHATREWQSESSVERSIAELVAKASRDAGRAAARVVGVAADDVSGRKMESLHAAGDAYVSLSHGEAWGLGAFDAATLGKPVIITGWGGQLDFLGADYPGLVRYRMVPVRDWLPTAQSAVAQRWAAADEEHAIELMRAAAGRDRRMLDGAAAARERILNEFAERVVVRQFLEALEG